MSVIIYNFCWFLQAYTDLESVKLIKHSSWLCTATTLPGQDCDCTSKGLSERRCHGLCVMPGQLASLFWEHEGSHEAFYGWGQAPAQHCLLHFCPAWIWDQEINAQTPKHLQNLFKRRYLRHWHSALGCEICFKRGKKRYIQRVSPFFCGVSGPGPAEPPQTPREKRKLFREVCSGLQG